MTKNRITTKIGLIAWANPIVMLFYDVFVVLGNISKITEGTSVIPFKGENIRMPENGGQTQKRY